MEDMANSAANQGTLDAALPRRRGRPKGSPKPPNSGRQKGTPNRWTKDVRAEASRHSMKAIGALVKLLKDPDGKIVATAARELLDRAHGRPMTPTELTGKDGAPLIDPAAYGDREVAQRIAFLLAKGQHSENPNGAAEMLAMHRQAKAQAEPMPVSVPAQAPAPVMSDYLRENYAMLNAADAERRAAPWRSVDHLIATPIVAKTRKDHQK